ncbi:MAG: hypothetical protein ACOY94_18865 [Bacillota bacterium]
MLSWLFGPRITVQVRVLGVVGAHVVRWEGQVRLPAGSDLRTALAHAGRAARVDLAGALDEGADPTILVNGDRVQLPEGLSKVVDADSAITWLMPLAGG